MSSKHKTIEVQGVTINRDNTRKKTLGAEIDKAVNAFLATIDPVEGSLDIKHQITLGAVDYDFVTISWDEAKKTK